MAMATYVLAMSAPNIVTLFHTRPAGSEPDLDTAIHGLHRPVDQDVRHEHADQGEQAPQHDSAAGQAQGDYLPGADRVRALRNDAGAPAAAGCRSP
jgi:hypothetical protein